MKYHTFQGASSATFLPPPLDGSLSLPQLWDYHMIHSPDHPLFIFEEVEGLIRTVPWSEGVRAIHTAARLVKSTVHLSERSQTEIPVVGTLASADSLSYFALCAGIIRAGSIPFPISIRNSDIGVAHLLHKTGVRHAFIRKDQATQNLASAALQKMDIERRGTVELLCMPSFSDLFGDSSDKFVPLPAMDKPGENSPAVILHSSGLFHSTDPIENPTHSPSVYNLEVNGERAYDTNDLLIRHPINPNLWKVFGRHDDQIMHSTGEKLTSRKLILLEGDMALEDFGLDRSFFTEMQRCTTSIFHNAWRVDFKVSLSTMEPLVRGTRNLVDFALGSPHPTPPKFVFTSSIGVFGKWAGVSAPESRIFDAEAAVATGYSQSKWVAESILAEAASRTTLQPIIVRVGQLAGGLNEYCNTRDWLPAIVKSGQALGCVPLSKGCASWIPIHKASAALVEMRFSEQNFLHLVHPNPVAWDDIFRHISRALDVPLVEYEEWLEKLEESYKADMAFADNPALHLLDFFRTVNIPLASADSEALGFPRLETRITVEIAPSMNCDSLGQRDVDAWVGYWRSVRFLH